MLKVELIVYMHLLAAASSNLPDQATSSMGDTTTQAFTATFTSSFVNGKLNSE